MTKTTPLLSMLIAVVLLACSATDIPYLLQPTSTPPPTATSIPPTATASLAVLPTHTLTPTLIGLRTEIAPTFPPPLTATPAPTNTATATGASVGVPTTAATGLAGTGFDAINLSSAVFYWGACEPTTVTLTATVTNPAQIDGLVLFTRVSDKATGSVTGWDKGTSMTMVGPGVYSRTLTGPHMDVTVDSWIQFQLVGSDSQNKVVARSLVYHDALSLSPCP
jgi:hypothetical protein